jgi:hypothetical protein
MQALPSVSGASYVEVFSEDADSRPLRGLLTPWRLLSNGVTGNNGNVKKGE